MKGRSGYFLGLCTVVTVSISLLLVAGSALADCGDRGGPGYRGPNGKCVGWAEMGKVCGAPPTMRCKAETVAPNTGEAAEHGAKVEELRQKAPPK